MEETNKEGGHTSTNNKPILTKDGGVTSWGNTYAFLCDGLNPTQIAKKQGLSRKTIHKRTNFYLDTGKIEKIAWGVYRKATKKNVTPPLEQVATVTQAPTMLPHKFGASFAQVGKPNLVYDKNGKAKDETPLYYAQFGRYKTQLWLYGGFEGTAPDELIKSGQLKIIAIAQQLAKKYNITLTLLRFYTDIEWVDISKERSKATAKEAGMKKKQRVEVADAIHVLDGTSHNDLLEIDKAPGKPNEIPTDHARIRHALYSGEYDRRISALLTLAEVREKASSEDRKLLHDVVDVLQQVKIRMDMKEAK